MSSDFAIIAADFATVEDAWARSATLAAASTATAAGPGFADFSADLHSAHLCGHEAFLSADPYCAAGGIILRAQTRDIDRTIASLMLMTKDRGLAVLDLDHGCIYDPRDHIDLHAYTGLGLHLPYLTEQLLAQVLAHQDFYGDFLLIQRTPQYYIQALCPPDAPRSSSTAPATPPTTIDW